MPWYDNDDESVFNTGIFMDDNTTLWGQVKSLATGEITRVRTKIGGIIGPQLGLRMAVYSDDTGEPGELLGQTLDLLPPDDNIVYEGELISSVEVNENQLVWVGIQRDEVAPDRPALRTEPFSTKNTTIRLDVGWTAGFPDPANAPTTFANATMAGIFVVIDANPDGEGLPTGTVIVTDGTERIDINNCGRIYIDEWTPFVPGPKGNGTWRESSLSSGRQLVDWQWENWVDVFNLGMHNTTQDKLIRQEQDLQRLLVKAHQYWTTDWQNEPVWLEARAPCETHTRYAIIKSWRTPIGSGNPFQQPFSLIGQRKSAIENFQLTVEHGPWLSDQPGTGRCIQISGTQESYPFHLEFNGDDSVVDCGSDAGLDDLPTGAFTAEAWVRADSFTPSGGVSFMCWKTQWYVQFNSTDGIRAFADYNVTDAISTSGVDDFDADGEWHHIAIVFVLVADLFRIFVDGNEVTYPISQNGVGAYVVDNANNFLIGNSTGLTQALDGAIGWFRLSNNNRYGAAFTPPPRCALPSIDGNTIAQWIGPEGSGATIDNQETTAARDGTQTDCEFGIDCEFGRDETCNEEVYIANKHNRAQLTHIFVDDGGVFGTNLIGETTPFLFLPAVPAVGDVVYFGIDTTFDDSGPFCSLVFDILTAQTDVTGIAWEYWNGAWVALTVQDNTDADGAMTGVAFDTTGVNSVHWNQPSDWTTTAVNGVTGYWVRARVTAIGAAPTGPYQQNRDIYTITWANINIDNVRAIGDISMLINLQISTQSGGDVASTARPYTNRVITGLRSVDRGDNFVAYLNAADEQNPSGITCRVDGALSVFANDVTSPTGRRITAAGTFPLSDIASWSFDNTISNHFYGTFHAFARGQLVAGAALDDVEIRLATGTGEGGTATFDQLFQTDFIQFDAVALTWRLLDFGQITLPPTKIRAQDPTVMGIELQAVTANAPTFYIYDLILIPVDENGNEVIDPTLELIHRILYSNRIELDSVTFPKQRIYTPLKETSSGEFQTPWQHIGNNGAFLQANADQRIWALAQLYFSNNWYAFPYIGHSVQVEGTGQYLYARGDR